MKCAMCNSTKYNMNNCSYHSVLLSFAPEANTMRRKWVISRMLIKMIKETKSKSLFFQLQEKMLLW